MLSLVVKICCCHFQDSITCLQGLVAYAIADTNRHLYNIEVTVEATSMGNYSEKVQLDSSNWVDLQQISVSHG